MVKNPTSNKKETLICSSVGVEARRQLGPIAGATVDAQREPLLRVAHFVRGRLEVKVVGGGASGATAAAAGFAVGAVAARHTGRPAHQAARVVSCTCGTKTSHDVGHCRRCVCDTIFSVIKKQPAFCTAGCHQRCISTVYNQQAKCTLTVFVRGGAMLPVVRAATSGASLGLALEQLNDGTQLLEDVERENALLHLVALDGAAQPRLYAAEVQPQLVCAA